MNCKSVLVLGVLVLRREKRKGNDMNTPKKKRKMVPMYSAADFFSGKKDAKPVGWMSDPDKSGLRKEQRNGKP